MTRRAGRTCLAATAALVALSGPAAAQPPACPAPLAQARRLVLVDAAANGSHATLQAFSRAGPGAPWRAEGGPASALIGRAGVAWGYAFRAYARAGEPVKVEGDKRSPAGFYRIGRPFGFAGDARPGDLRIGADTVCVDDPRSPAYGTITSRARVGRQVHGEAMGRVPQYRLGLVVDYPTSRQARAGSCIFIHLRVTGATATSGCVAVTEPRLRALQAFASPGAVVAILPRGARDRFAGCLPPEPGR